MPGERRGAAPLADFQVVLAAGLRAVTQQPENVPQALLHADLTLMTGQLNPLRYAHRPHPRPDEEVLLDGLIRCLHLAGQRQQPVQSVGRLLAAGLLEGVDQLAFRGDVAFHGGGQHAQDISVHHRRPPAGQRERNFSYGTGEQWQDTAMCRARQAPSPAALVGMVCRTKRVSRKSSSPRHGPLWRQPFQQGRKIGISMTQQ